jgi:hypothetical protein
MSHLSRTELLDLIEDPDGPDRHRTHLESCDECRATAAALRATIADVRRDDGIEPSPLFWDHFAMRVSDAIRDESPTAPKHFRLAWLGGRTPAWMAAALLVLLGMTAVISRVTLHAPTPVIDRSATVDPLGQEKNDPDQNWVHIREQASWGNLPWDATEPDAISAGPGTAEQVVMELTADERAELARLIDRELKRSGA